MATYKYYVEADDVYRMDVETKVIEEYYGNEKWKKLKNYEAMGIDLSYCEKEYAEGKMKELDKRLAL